MALRRLIPLTAFLLAAAATCSWGADDGEPHLQDRAAFVPIWMASSNHLEFSSDGRTLYTYGVVDGKVRLWHVASGKQTAKRLRHDINRVVEFAASPDGKLLATVTRRGTVWIWDARTFKKIRSLEGPKYTTHLMFGPDSEILSAVAMGKLYVCRVKKDEEFRLEREIDPHQSYDKVRPVASSGPPKRPLLVCGNRLFDAVTGGESYRLSEGKFDNRGMLHTAITSDEKKMATCCPGFIHLWDRNAANEDPARRKRLVLEYPTMVFRCLTFSPNNQVLAVGYEDNPGPGLSYGGILFLDATSGKLLDKQGTGGAFGVCSLAFSPDGRLLASGDRVGVVKLWEVPAAWRKKAK